MSLKQFDFLEYKRRIIAKILAGISNKVLIKRNLREGMTHVIGSLFLTNQ